MRPFPAFIAFLLGGVGLGMLATGKKAAPADTPAPEAPPAPATEPKKEEEFKFVPLPGQEEERRAKMRALGKLGGQKRVENLKKKKGVKNGEAEKVD